MKVLYIVSSFPRNEKDTYVRWLLEKTQRLADEGVEITVLAPSYKGLGNHRFGKVNVKRFRYFLKRWEDLTHEEGMGTKIKSSLYRFIFFFYFFSGLISTIKLCRQEKFDIIHVHWPFPHAIWAYYGARANKSKVILTFYAVELLLIKRKFKFLKSVVKRIIEKADRVTTFSSYVKELVKEYTEREVEVIPYGTTIEEKKFKVANNKVKRILFVGRLIERKGLRYLIMALPAISKEIESKVIIIGDGEEMQPLKKFASDLHIEKKVEFLEKISNQRLTQEYQNCDVFVLPAIIDSKGDTEGLGVVLIEALLYKKPIVASKVGGIVDVIKDGKTGFLSREKDEKDLADKIIKVLKNRKWAEKVGRQGYRFVKENFEWEKITDKYLSLYKRTLRR